MMLNWNDYRKQLAIGVKEVASSAPTRLRGTSRSAPLAKKRICSAPKSES